MKVRLQTPWFRRGVLAVLVGIGLSACSPRQLLVGSLADELASPALGNETDLILLRDAAPFHLKLSETVLRQQPGHRALAEAVAAGFTQYAYAFLAFDADRIEATDAAAAERLRRRAAGFYARAHRHAMTALETSQPGLAAALAGSTPGSPLRIEPAQVGLAYWAAASWGGWISLSKDEPDVVADLPLAIRLAEAAWRVDPAWGQGALSGLMGSFEAARPGGSPALALRYFDQAIRDSGGAGAAALVAKAEGYALPGGDRPMFETLLRQALAIREAAGSPLAVQNEVMRQRAAWLLSKADDLF
jgi:hypothetical protein